MSSDSPVLPQGAGYGVGEPCVLGVRMNVY